MKYMKLITKEIEKEFAKHPFGSTDGQGEDAKVLLKVFNPYGLGTWLITEAEKDDEGNWMGYGLCDIGFPEWGYVSLKELQDARIKVFGCLMGLERDMYCTGTVAQNKR